MLRKIGIVCGVPDICPTDLRRGVEKEIQSNENMKTKSKVINMHSEEVGRHVYDKSNSRTRAEFVNSMTSKETPLKEMKKRPDKKRKIEMEQMEDKDSKTRKKHAQEFLQTLRSERIQNRKRNTRCCMSPPDRSFLLNLVYQEVFHSIRQEFPKGNKDQP